MVFRLKTELKAFIASDDYILCATLTPDRPVTIDEFTRYVDIFFIKFDSGIYGKNLLDKNDASNRYLELHPEAKILWNSQQRIKLERNRKGYMNGLHRHVMIERKEVSVNDRAVDKEVDRETWERASGIVINIDDDKWEQKDRAKSNKRKVSQLINRYERAWWHCHFICSEPKDIEGYNYKRLQRRIERTWANLKYIYPVNAEADGVIGSCMVKPFKNNNQQQKCFTYITKQVNSYAFSKDIIDAEIPEAFYYWKCSNTGIYTQLTELEQAQKALRQQSAIGINFNQFR
jgi:hypothetical protein